MREVILKDNQFRLVWESSLKTSPTYPPSFFKSKSLHFSCIYSPLDSISINIIPFIIPRCPEFLHLVTSSVLATDVSRKERQEKIQDRFERVVIHPHEGVSEFEKTQAVVEQILLLAGMC